MIDRRRFLLGASGALLALPWLEAFIPRRANAATLKPPKRLLIFAHGHGRIVGSGAGPDLWSPQPGPLPQGAPASPLLAQLQPIHGEIVTIDGVDNIVRYATGHLSANADGHFSAARTFLSCQVPNEDGSGTGPSIDYVAGLQLRANAGMLPSIVFPADSANADFENVTQNFFGANGSPPQLAHINPIAAAAQVFASASAGTTSDVSKRLLARRGNILDSVNKSFASLRARVGAADRARLDAHSQFIESLQTMYALGGAGQMPVTSCSPPKPSSFPNIWSLTMERGQANAVTTPLQIENAIQALACDVTRVAAVHFWNNSDVVFPMEFKSTSPFTTVNWHQSIHIGDKPTELSTAFQFYAQMFTQTVQRLASITDTDGSRMLDNTLVLWVSDMGYGQLHYDWNVPVVMAGMKSAFPKGQGRHVVAPNRATLGDVYAQALRMLGGTATTFGATGTLGSVTGNMATDPAFFMSSASYDNSAGPSTPLHNGALDL